VSLRLGRLIAASVVMLAAAGCGSHSTTSSNSSGSIASTPASTPVTLSETGSTLLYTLFDTWASVYQTKYSNVSITTGATGSGNGIAQAAAGAVTIGGSDSYLSEADMSAHKSLMNIALAISAQQINYNLPGVKENLKLNGAVLAAMYRGDVKAWNDPQIAALNPGVTLPDTPVVPLHRSDGSGDTFLFTQYLSKQDPDGWGKSPGFGTTVDFPAAPGALAEKGNGGMVTGCAKTPGCVAYVGVSFSNQAEQAGLGEAAVANKSGKYMMLTAKSMKMGAADLAAQTPANEAISLIDGPAADGYPIVNYEYAIVDSHQKDPSTAQTLQAFLHWAITDGQTPPFLGKVRFQPLPAAVLKLSDAQIAKISG
jgi:phosphate transport system substrate-binding protein